MISHHSAGLAPISRLKEVREVGPHICPEATPLPDDAQCPRVLSHNGALAEVSPHFSG